MKLFIRIIITYAMLWVFAAYGTAPNLTDRILIMYKIDPSVAATFSATDGRLSSFWDQWDLQNAQWLTLDYLSMASDNAMYAWNRCATSPFAGADDVKMEIRAAYTNQAAYFYVKVEDNNWVDYTGWSTDVVDIYIDAKNSTAIADSVNWFNPTQWALTFSSKEIQVGMGSTVPVTGYTIRYYDDLVINITDYPPKFGDPAYDGMAMEVISVGTNVKVQEWMVPLTQWGITNTTEETKYGFTCGYNDVDTDAPDCVNSLRWVGLCDPYCEPPNPATWGDIELGPSFGSYDCWDPCCYGRCDSSNAIPRIKTNNNFKQIVHTDFFSIRGERMVPSIAHGTNQLFIRQTVLANGKTDIERARFRSR